MITISMQNSGGELDSRTVATEEEAAAALIEMVRETGSICPGDKFVVTGDEESL